MIWTMKFSDVDIGKADMKKITQAVILAGGVGERLRPYTETNPKPMYPVNGKPFIEYLVRQIKNWGIEDIVILLGYLPEKIMNYLGDGSNYSVNIRYIVTPVEYETQFRLRAAEDILEAEFLMMYCDNICPVNFEKLVYEYRKNNALIQLSVYANEDGYTRNNLKIIDNHRVVVYDKKRISAGLHGVDIGYAIVSREVINLMSLDNQNFETIVYPKLVESGKLFATVTKHRYYSIGSFERITLTEKFLSGQKYIFLDRDGTINKRPPKGQYICKAEEFEWLYGAKEAIKKLNDAGYFIIIISNQAGIARGMMTVQDFEEVQNKMKTELAETGAHVDAIYYCPHGWNDECECRKPKPGMIYQAQKDYSIDLSKCVMIGDDIRDIIMAHNADMKGILIRGGYSLMDAVNDVLQGKIIDYEVRDL